MNLLKEYLNRANEIIGDRTKDEERYDKEVLRWLRNSIDDVAAHYEYLLEHESILQKISH